MDTGRIVIAFAHSARNEHLEKGWIWERPWFRKLQTELQTPAKIFGAVLVLLFAIAVMVGPNEKAEPENGEKYKKK